MILKGIAATTEVDRHNCKITKEALEKAIADINTGSFAPGVGIEHDHTVLPIGKVLKGEIISMPNGEFAAQIHQEIFDEFTSFMGPDNSIFYFAESKVDSRPFVDSSPDQIEALTIGIDPVNFSREDFDMLQQFLSDECSAQSEVVMRKSLVPDPEILFHLVFGTLLFWSGKRVVEKLSDHISTDIASCYGRIKKVICKTVQYCNPRNRPITYVFRESNQYVTELIIQTNSPNVVLDSLQCDKINVIFTKIDQMKAHLHDEIAKVQLLYDPSSEEWELNYLTSTTGQVIGSEKCYKKTAKLLETVVRESKMQNSVSGSSNIESEE